MFRAVSALVLMSTLVWGMTFSSLPIASFLDIPSAVFIVGIVFGGVASSHGPAMALQVFNPFGNKDFGFRHETRNRYLSALRRASQLSYGAAIVGLLIAAISILPNLTDPSQAGSGFAAALVCPLYAVLLSGFLFDGIRNSIEHQPESYSGMASGA